MRKFDKLFNKIITEYKSWSEMEDLDYKIRYYFFDLMSEACDLAELTFNSKEEREGYIFNCWVDFADNIIEYVKEYLNGKSDSDDLSEEELKNAVKSAIANNSKSILGVENIFE